MVGVGSDNLYETTISTAVQRWPGHSRYLDCHGNDPMTESCRMRMRRASVVEPNCRKYRFTSPERLAKINPKYVMWLNQR